MAKVKKTTAQNEVTGITRNILLLEDKTMRFDLGCASVPITEKGWIRSPISKKHHVKIAIALLLIVTTALEIWSLL